jgi:hypothetical protein
MIVKGGRIRVSKERIRREKYKIRSCHLIADALERAFALIL